MPDDLQGGEVDPARAAEHAAFFQQLGSKNDIMQPLLFLAENVAQLKVLEYGRSNKVKLAEVCQQLKITENTLRSVPQSI